MPYYTTSIADEFNISLNTARNWAKEYKEVLSDGASVEGAQRVFTERDRQVFKFIKLLRSEGLRRNEIIERIKQENLPDIDEPDVSQDNQPTALAVAPDRPGETQTNIMIANTLDAHTRRLEALEQAKAVPVASSRMADVILGILLALGFVIMMLLLALIYGVPR